MRDSYLPGVQGFGYYQVLLVKNEYSMFMCEQKKKKRLKLERESFIISSF